MSDTVAAGSRRRLLYVKEDSWGVTPSGAGVPVMKTLRNTGGSGFGMRRGSEESAEFRSDRAVADVRLGVQRVNADIPFELSWQSMDDMLEAALFGTWATNTLKQGVTATSFTFEEGFTDIGVYLTMPGTMVDTWSLNIQPEGRMITGSFGLMSKIQNDVAAATIADTITVANTNAPFDSFTGGLDKDATPLAVVTSMQLNLSNNLAQLFAAFNKGSFAITAGRANVTGSVTLYFTDSAFIEEYQNETEVKLEVLLTDLAGNSYLITIPRVKWTDNTRNLTENTITQQVPFVGLYDSVSGTSLQIDRIPSA